MSALIGHAKAARILADAIERQAATLTDLTSGRMLLALADAHRCAARDMEGEMRAEATGNQVDPI